MSELAEARTGDMQVIPGQTKGWLVRLCAAGEKRGKDERKKPPSSIEHQSVLVVLVCQHHTFPFFFLIFTLSFIDSAESGE
jgi:hypothetical protein